MAKIERSINEDFDQLLSNIENGILNSSISATLEDASDFQSGTARCSVRIFERYSYAGGNRVSRLTYQRVRRCVEPYPVQSQITEA